MDASEYKSVVLGLIFLKYVSDAFEEKNAELIQDEHMAENIFWVPKKHAGHISMKTLRNLKSFN